MGIARAAARAQIEALDAAAVVKVGVVVAGAEIVAFGKAVALVV